MGVDLWFREDVARILLAVEEAMQASLQGAVAGQREVAEAYRQGFVDGLRVVGVAFGGAAPGAANQIGRSQAPWVVEGEVWKTPALEGGRARRNGGSR